MLLIVAYSAIAFTYTLNDELVPVWASTSVENRGLALDSNALGLALSVGGVVLMATATLIYPRASTRLGNFLCNRLGLASMVVIAFLYPLCALLAARAPRAAFATFTLITCVRNVSANFAFTGSMARPALSRPGLAWALRPLH